MKFIIEYIWNCSPGSAFLFLLFMLFLTLFIIQAIANMFAHAFAENFLCKGECHGPYKNDTEKP